MTSAERDRLYAELRVIGRKFVPIVRQWPVGMMRFQPFVILVLPTHIRGENRYRILWPDQRIKDRCMAVIMLRSRFGRLFKAEAPADEFAGLFIEGCRAIADYPEPYSTARQYVALYGS